MHDVGLAGRGEDVVGGFLDQRCKVRLRVARQQPDQPRGVGANPIEQIGREFRDTEQDTPRERLRQQRIERSRLLRLQFGKPVSKNLFGIAGSSDMRPVDEAPGEALSFRVARRG